MQTLPLFPPWVERLSRKDPTKRYYYNTATHEVCGRRCELPSSAFASTDEGPSQVVEETPPSPVVSEVDEIFLQEGIQTIQKKKSFLELNGYKHLFSTKKCDFWGCKKEDGFLYETRKKIEEPLQIITKKRVMPSKTRLRVKVPCRKNMKEAFGAEGRSKNKSLSDDDSDYVPGR